MPVLLLSLDKIKKEVKTNEKVIYSIAKVWNEEKLKGVGYLSDSGDLLVHAISSKGKPYIKVFEEAAKKCHQNPETGEHKGYMTIQYQLATY